MKCYAKKKNRKKERNSPTVYPMIRQLNNTCIDVLRGSFFRASDHVSNSIRTSDRVVMKQRQANVDSRSRMAKVIIHAQLDWGRSDFVYCTFIRLLTHVSPGSI
jgi:hypothetical protein